ncbi:peptidyl-prolyl cis-trans isomerase FKBP43-like [Syzygium oleosum]|uniref:peptidyl-prolyl cis-trans isomerase FKBP43-like n=1 Tax=Syzygium oleosum TaxID=219896 RepID=UPI0024BAF50D|nr:peptidyl-prolyl cis-trans isomerase FKBP43-like [Syzygium oleosum]
MLCSFQESCFRFSYGCSSLSTPQVGTCGGTIIASGIEVKPGKPYNHEPNGSRLHISQATLGIGVATNKSTVQCNVGDASPVFICSLFPGKEESAQINLEFEESHQVIFSVLGVRSVHLTGYYLGRGREFVDDLESYGEDIADTETDISEDDDQYEDSFINDGDVEFLPPSPIPNKSEKEKPNHKKARKGKDHRQRLRKKHEKGESDKVNSLPQQNSEALLLESDEEDFFVSSLLKKKSSAKESEINAPVVVMETPLDFVKKKRKQDGSTAVKSTESLSPTVVGGEPGSTAKKMKSKLHIVEGETQNQAWQEDKEPKADDPSQKSSAVEVEQVPSGENCKKSKKKKKKDDSLPHQNPEARSSEPDGEDFSVSSPLEKKFAAKDSETKIPDVVIETPLDVAEKKQKQDGSTAVKSSERLSPSVVEGEPGSSGKEIKRKLQFMEEEMQNQAWQEDKEPKADYPTLKSSAVEEQVSSGENCKKSKRKKRKSKLPNGEERRM